MEIDGSFVCFNFNDTYKDRTIHNVSWFVHPTSILHADVYVSTYQPEHVASLLHQSFDHPMHPARVQFYHAWTWPLNNRTEWKPTSSRSRNSSHIKMPLSQCEVEIYCPGNCALSVRSAPSFGYLVGTDRVFMFNDGIRKTDRCKGST